MHYHFSTETRRIFIKSIRNKRDYFLADSTADHDETWPNLQKRKLVTIKHYESSNDSRGRYIPNLFVQCPVVQDDRRG